MTYLDDLKLDLCGMSWQDPPIPVPWDMSTAYDEDKRRRGVDWPQNAYTMIGLARLDHLQWCVERALDDSVPGDLLEAGVWRGGACILMRAILLDRWVTTRSVWAADSFAGFPEAEAAAECLNAPEQDHLAVSMEQVQENFRACGLLDGQVKFLPGYFADSLPAAPVEELALLRLDGDLHSSTLEILTHLYPKVTAGGFVIVDDWSLAGCQHAVRQYRAEHDITDPIRPVPGCEHEGQPVAMWWRKS